MAYILKSNVIVEDNDGKFPYLTPFGETNKYASSYFNEMAEKGYNLTLSDFNAIHDFTQGLIDNGVMDSIIELYPFMGSTINQSLVKLKHKSVKSAFIRNNTGNVLFDGKGLSFPNYLTSGVMGIGTGLKISEVYEGSGFGISAYIKYDNSDARTEMRNIFSAASTVVGGNGSGSDAIITSRRPSGAVTNKLLVSSPSFPNIPTAQDTASGIVTLTNRWNESKQIYERTSRWNGSVLGTSASNVQLSPPTFDTDFNIGSAHVLADNSSYYSFHGKIRFIAVLNGSVDASIASQIEQAISTFITATGKNVF